MNNPGEYWDAVVVGAGVAGGVTAAMLAQRGWRVLLVEKSAWPREKVCGGCLSAAGVDALRELGLDSALGGAGTFDRVIWQLGSRRLEVALPRGAALMRDDLDAGIVSEAIRRGCKFRPGCSASLLPASSGDGFRMLRLQCADRMVEAFARIVIACDGIGGTLLAGEPWAKWRISRGAWIGVAATYPAPADAVNPGEIHMYVGNNGYVGMVRMNAAHEHMAAALDPEACRRAGGPAKLVREILGASGRKFPEGMESARFRGTGALTRRREQIGGHRVMALGDACGYVEPFTGEGMAWAIMGARELVGMLPDGEIVWSVDLPARWRRRHLEIIGRRQRWCRGIRPTMHHRVLSSAGMFIGSSMPGLIGWVAQTICQPGAKEIHNDNSGRFHLAQAPARVDPGDIGDRYGQPAIGAARGGI